MKSKDENGDNNGGEDDCGRIGGNGGGEDCD